MRTVADCQRLEQMLEGKTMKEVKAMLGEPNYYSRGNDREWNYRNSSELFDTWFAPPVRVGASGISVTFDANGIVEKTSTVTWNIY